MEGRMGRHKGKRLFARKIRKQNIKRRKNKVEYVKVGEMTTVFWIQAVLKEEKCEDRLLKLSYDSPIISHYGVCVYVGRGGSVERF